MSYLGLTTTSQVDKKREDDVENVFTGLSDSILISKVRGCCSILLPLFSPL